MVIRVLLADDNRAVRDALRLLLARESQVQVVAEADDGEAATRLALALRPEVVLMDISMPRVNGFEAARRITAGSVGALAAKSPGVKVIALSLHADWQVVVEALRAGASGYLLKTGVAREFGRAVRCVAGGNVYLSDKVLETIQRDDAEASSGRSDQLQSLTEPERRALHLLAEGFARNGVSADTGCSRFSAEAVEPHRQGIMEKLGLPTFAELMRFALRQQLSTAGRSD